MRDFDNGRADDPEQYEERYKVSRLERLRNNPDYGDWLYDQEKDRKMEDED